MDEDRDDFEEKMEEDEIDALDEHDLILGLDDDGLPLEEDDDSDEDKMDRFGFHDENEEPEY